MTYSESQMPRWQRTLATFAPVDLLVVWSFAIATVLVVETGTESVVRFLLAVPALFLLPGYALVAALFPHAADATAPRYATETAGLDRVTPRERLAFAFGLSVALLPLIGIAIAVSPWALTATVVSRAIAAFVIVVGVVGVLRRRRLPLEDQFHPPIGQWTAGATGSEAASSVDRVLTIALVASIVLAIGVVGWAIAVPQDGEQFTDFAVLTESDDGELTAGDYPDELTAGQPAEFVTAVENHEGEQRDYTVVVTIEPSPPDDGDGVGEQTELERYGATVEDGERWTQRHEIVPETTAEDARVNYYLYEGTAPDDPGPDTAYRHNYVWVDVQP